MSSAIPSDPSMPPAIHNRVCPHCGKTVASDRKRLCNHCGEEFSPEPAPSLDLARYCVKCGTLRFDPIAVFCPQCGSPYEPTSSKAHPQAKSSRPLVRPATVLLTLIVIVGCLWFSGYLAWIAPGRAPAHCAVGLNGAAVSVTVDGGGALAQCQSFLRQTTDSGSWYIYADGVQPAGAVICQVDLYNDRFVVRDQGVLNIYGTQICQNLSQIPAR